jgi:hypothetical protein
VTETPLPSSQHGVGWCRRGTEPAICESAALQGRVGGAWIDREPRARWRYQCRASRPAQACLGARKEVVLLIGVSWRVDRFLAGAEVEVGVLCCRLVARRCHNISTIRQFVPGPSQVGSGTGAPTLGSGGASSAFAPALSPAPVITFPAPATSNPACRFPAPGFPAVFTPRVMGPIELGVLSATVV